MIGLEQHRGQIAYDLLEADQIQVIRSGRTPLEELADQMGSRGHWWDLF